MADEAAEDEKLSELLRQRKLEFSDVAKDLAHRGQRVSVEFGGHSFGGIVVGAGVDYATINSPDQTGDVRFDVGTWSILTAAPSDEPSVDRSESFKALLHEYSAAETNVRLSLPGGEMVIGAIAVVAVDHIVVTDADGRRIYIPIPMVLGVIRAAEHH